MSISALSQSAVEEKIKWRQDENDNDGETAMVTAKNSSPTSVAAILSRNSSRLGQNQQIYSPNAGKKAKGPVVNYYVVLEKSPPPVSSEESDTSTYDKSFHCRETDFCQDSTDYDSSSGDGDSFATEGMASIDFLEYEVASASDDDADTVNNSSSGTEDHGLIMSAAAVGSLDTSSSSSDFADSEESDSDKLFDKELSDADFWKCIQCRNPNNNPLYPMCEKCYKIRRTHFPPRPKPRKKKLNRHRKSGVSTTNGALTEKLSSDVSVSTSQDGEMSKRLCSEVTGKDVFIANAASGYNSFKRHKLNNYTNKNQLNSASETSEDDSRKRKSPLNRLRHETLSTNLSSSGRSSLNVNNRLATTSVSRKRSPSPSHEKEMWQTKKSRIANDQTVSSADTECDTDNDSVALLANNNTQKDSGVSSAPSSQEPPLSSFSDEKSIETDELIQPIGGNLSDNTIRAQVLGVLKQSNEITTQALFSGIKHSNLIRSVSDITNPLNNNLASEAFTMNSLDPSFSTYGSCTMCFSGPKNGVFVHTNNVHLCSCYKCAVRIWSKDKKCPVCNVSAKNVLKLFVH